MIIMIESAIGRYVHLRLFHTGPCLDDQKALAIFGGPTLVNQTKICQHHNVVSLNETIEGVFVIKVVHVCSARDTEGSFKITFFSKK